MWLMSGPSGLISTLIGPTLASTAVPVAMDGRMSTTSTSIVSVDPSPIVMERNASMRVPSRLPVTKPRQAFIDLAGADDTEAHLGAAGLGEHACRSFRRNARDGDEDG